MYTAKIAHYLAQQQAKKFCKLAENNALLSASLLGLGIQRKQMEKSARLPSIPSPEWYPAIGLASGISLGALTEYLREKDPEKRQWLQSTLLGGTVGGIAGGGAYALSGESQDLTKISAQQEPQAGAARAHGEQTQPQLPPGHTAASTPGHKRIGPEISPPENLSGHIAATHGVPQLGQFIPNVQLEATLPSRDAWGRSLDTPTGWKEYAPYVAMPGAAYVGAVGPKRVIPATTKYITSYIGAPNISSSQRLLRAGKLGSKGLLSSWGVALVPMTDLASANLRYLPSDKIFGAHDGSVENFRGGISLEEGINLRRQLADFKERGTPLDVALSGITSPAQWLNYALNPEQREFIRDADLAQRGLPTAVPRSLKWHESVGGLPAREDMLPTAMMNITKINEAVREQIEQIEKNDTLTPEMKERQLNVVRDWGEEQKQKQVAELLQYAPRVDTPESLHEFVQAKGGAGTPMSWWHHDRFHKAPVEARKAILADMPTEVLERIIADTSEQMALLSDKPKSIHDALLLTLRRAVAPDVPTEVEAKEQQFKDRRALVLEELAKRIRESKKPQRNYVPLLLPT